MEIDIPDGSDKDVDGIKENGLHLYPVPENGSGEGLPYAPIDWPNPGDNWSWKVGKRVAFSGYFQDRYLYLPSSLQPGGRKKGGFASKLSAMQYLLANFPDADISGFFASFSWKIPSKKFYEIKGNEGEITCLSTPSKELGDNLSSESHSTLSCKAGNKMCSSLLEPIDTPLEAMDCDFCCSEPGFCRSCCCILCSKTINTARESYKFIKCEAMVCEGFICGHIAHLDCGLRSYMAGTVGGSIGLDAEYYCRRCDSRSNLVVHVKKLLRTCESNKSLGDLEKILKLGVCILRDSQKPSAKILLRQIEHAMVKLKSGSCLEDIWKMEDPTVLADHETDGLEVVDQQEPIDFTNTSPRILSGKFDHRVESLRLENEINEVLQELRKSQESEYRIAEETLGSQKNYILNLYQQLDKEKSVLSRRTSKADPDALLDAVLKRVDHIKREILKLRDMEQVAKGFGRTSKKILKEHFGLDIEH